MRRAIVLALALVSGAALTLARQEPVQEGTWIGTRIRANRNTQQTQRISLEIKKVPDPHSAWRPAGATILSVTLVIPKVRLQVSDFRLEQDRLSFTYREETPSRCQLTRQADGSYEGDCVGDGETRGAFRITLTPPKSAS